MFDASYNNEVFFAQSLVEKRRGRDERREEGEEKMT